MPSIAELMSYFNPHTVKGAAVLGGVTAGAVFGTGAYFGGRYGYQDAKATGDPDPWGEAQAGAGLGMAAVGLTAAGLGAAALLAKPAWKTAGALNLGKHTLDATMGMASRYARNLRDDFDAAIGWRKQVGVLANRRLLTMGAGATVGGLIGSHFGHPGEGAAVGALAGAAIPTALTAARLAGKVPAKSITIPLMLTLAVMAGGHMLKPPGYDMTADAIPNDSMGYDYGATGTGKRLRMMNATGDVTLGLHRRRHG